MVSETDKEILNSLAQFEKNKSDCQKQRGQWSGLKEGQCLTDVGKQCQDSSECQEVCHAKMTEEQKRSLKAGQTLPNLKGTCGKRTFGPIFHLSQGKAISTQNSKVQFKITDILPQKKFASFNHEYDFLPIKPSENQESAKNDYTVGQFFSLKVRTVNNSDHTCSVSGKWMMDQDFLNVLWVSSHGWETLDEDLKWQLKPQQVR